MVTNRRRPIHRSIDAVPVHPLLLAAYAVVFLFATNAAEQLTLGPLWPPLAVAVGATGVVLIVLGVLLRDWIRAGLVTSVLVFGFFGYGHAWNAVANMLDTQWPFIVAWVLLIAGLAVAAWRAGRWGLPLTRFLNVAIGLLVLVNVVSVGNAMVARGANDAGTGDLTDLQLAPGDGQGRPDVYYIVPDRYASVGTLRDVFGYDNEPFLHALEERGFSVARDAHSNYPRTGLSLASALSLELLDDDALEEAADDPGDWTPIYDMLAGRQVVPAALKELGYSYVHLGNWWRPTQGNVDADRELVFSGQDEFTNALAQTTFLRAFTDPDVAPDDPWDWQNMYAGNLWALDRLEEIPGMPGPKYVFAHLTTTHPPYVHNEDGSFTGRDQVAELGNTESYRRQLVYANERLLGVIDRIIASDDDAVIVLAADEGPFPDRFANADWRPWPSATDEELQEKTGILLAMRVPGADLEAEGFHDELTLVNAFRIVFNARFGTDLPLLPDRTFIYAAMDRLYDFIDVTARLN